MDFGRPRGLKKSQKIEKNRSRGAFGARLGFECDFGSHFGRFGRVLGGFGEGLGRVWEGFGEGLGRVGEGLGDEILKPLAKRGTAGGLRSALLNNFPVENT